MAGNATDARKRLDNQIAEAKRSGASSTTIGQLEAQRAVLRNDELSQTGQHEQASGWF